MKKKKTKKHFNRSLRQSLNEWYGSKMSDSSEESQVDKLSDAFSHQAKPLRANSMIVRSERLEFTLKVRSGSFIKPSEANMDNLIKEENKAPVRLNLFTSFDQNDTRFLT